MGKIILVTGGARSGKSLFAERYAAAHGKTVAYIATAQIYDEEMRDRVKRHRERRPDNWVTYEAPYQAENVFKEIATETILFDCLTLYMTNLLLSQQAPADREERFTYIMTEIEKLLNAAQQCGKTVVFVTNEVGDGIVPENELAREYRDVAGSVNQKMAAAADDVYAVICGLAINIKQLAVSPEEV